MMKVTIPIFSLLSLAALAGAGALEQRELADTAAYAITFVSTAKDDSVSPNDIVTTFKHADVSNAETDGTAYGSVEVKYYNVANQGCYNAADDVGTTCSCNTASEVHSPAGGITTIAAAVTTTDDVSTGADEVMTVVRDELAPLLNSDAATVVDDKVYVAYCIRLSLKTDDATPLLANSQDVLVYFTGTNDPDADFEVNADAEADGNANPTPDDFTVTARLCSGTVGVDSPLPEGSSVNICVESDDDPAARIVAITSWTWIHVASSTSQAAIALGTPVNDLTTLGTCTAATVSNGVANVKSKCDFTTLLGTTLFDAIGAGNGGIIDGSGVVSMKFNGEARVRLARVRLLQDLEDGDDFPVPAALALSASGPEKEDGGSCDCFFLNIFCWIFKCLLAWLFGSD